MTDIAERLRHEATSKEVGFMEQGCHASDRYRLLMEASAEIARLRAVEKAAETAFRYHMLGYAAGDEFDAGTMLDLMNKLGAALKDTKP